MTVLIARELRAIAMSISDSPDMGAFGLGDGHLRHATAEIALFLLSSGNNLAYGGDLRSHGFTELLFQLDLRYRRQGELGPKVVDYLAWPVHIRMNTDDLVSRARKTRGFVQLVLLGKHGEPLAMEERRALPSHEPDKAEWETGLTAMRRTMRSQSHARVVLGGRIDGYRGRMPGVAEEALLSLECQQPVFLVGGFGGCTRDIAETLELVDRWAGSRAKWPGRQEFDKYRQRDLRNGLTLGENRKLADTPHVDQAITLMLRGLHRLESDGAGIDTHEHEEG